MNHLSTNQNVKIAFPEPRIYQGCEQRACACGNGAGTESPALPLAPQPEWMSDGAVTKVVTRPSLRHVFPPQLFTALVYYQQTARVGPEGQQPRCGSRSQTAQVPSFWARAGVRLQGGNEHAHPPCVLRVRSKSCPLTPPVCWVHPGRGD